MNPDNANRVLTRRAIALFPGIHLRRLQKVLGTSFTTTRYHVDSLERAGEISCLRDGRYERLYPAGMTQEMKSLYACLQSETVRTVLHLLAENPDELTKTDISSRIRLAPSTTGECIGLLEESSVVRRAFTSDGRAVYGIKDAENVLPLLAIFRRNLVDVATDNFLNLWDV